MRPFTSYRLRLETLENRTMPATFVVVNTNDAGPARYGRLPVGGSGNGTHSELVASHFVAPASTRESSGMLAEEEQEVKPDMPSSGPTLDSDDTSDGPDTAQRQPLRFRANSGANALTYRDSVEYVLGGDLSGQA